DRGVSACPWERGAPNDVRIRPNLTALTTSQGRKVTTRIQTTPKCSAPISELPIADDPLFASDICPWRVTTNEQCSRQPVIEHATCDLGCMDATRTGSVAIDA